MISHELNRAARDPHRHAIERKRAATVDLCTDAGGILSFGHFSNGVGASVNWAAAPAARVMRMSEERIVMLLAQGLAQRYNLRYPPRAPKTRTGGRQPLWEHRAVAGRAVACAQAKRRNPWKLAASIGKTLAPIFCLRERQQKTCSAAQRLPIVDDGTHRWTQDAGAPPRHR